jgi:hypothetical protein
MDLEIIINPKAMGDGQAVIQVPISSFLRFDTMLTPVCSWRRLPEQQLNISKVPPSAQPREHS